MTAYPIRCSGCWSRIAVAPVPTSLRHKIYCSAECADHASASEDYERNIQWLALNDSGWTPVMIARLYGVAHSLVYRTLDRMREVEAA